MHRIEYDAFRIVRTYQRLNYVLYTYGRTLSILFPICNEDKRV
jgi:hypothetical protein